MLAPLQVFENSQQSDKKQFSNYSASKQIQNAQHPNRHYKQNSFNDVNLTSNIKQRERSSSCRQLSPQVKIYNRNFLLRNAYKSALQSQHEQQIQRNANIPKVLQTSYKILYNKIDSNIESTIQQLIRNHEQIHLQEITYEQMSQAMLKLNPYLFKDPKEKNRTKRFQPNFDVELEQLLSQMWIYLKNYDIESEYLSIDVFKTFMRIILDPKHLKPQQIKQLIHEVLFTELVQNYVEKRKEFLDQYPQVQDQTLQDIQIFKLWFKMKQKYYRFQKQSQQVMKQKSKRKYNDNLTFQPQINQKSKEYAMNSLKKYLSSNRLEYEKQLNHHPGQHSRANFHQQKNQLEHYISTSQHHKSSYEQEDSHSLYHPQSHNNNTYNNEEEEEHYSIAYHELLYRRKLQKEKVTRRLQYDMENQKNFTPTETKKLPQSQIKQIIDKVYYVPEKKSDLNYHQIMEKRQLKKCTFKPSIIENFSVANNLKGGVGSGQLVKGFQSQVERLAKGRKQRQKQKQIYDNLGRPKQKALTSKMPSFIERDMPKLILEVNIGDGQIQKIKLKGDQDPKLVAKKFVSKYNLQSSMISVLQDLIDENLRNL